MKEKSQRDKFLSWDQVCSLVFKGIANSNILFKWSRIIWLQIQEPKQFGCEWLIMHKF